MNKEITKEQAEVQIRKALASLSVNLEVHQALQSCVDVLVKKEAKEE